jgi:hypothetical protein
MLAAFVAAVAIAERRATMLIVIGLGVLVICAAVVLVVRLGQEPLSRVVGSEVTVDAFDAGYHAVTSSFVTQTLVLAGVGAVSAAAGVALKLRAARTRRPGAWA